MGGKLIKLIVYWFFALNNDLLVIGFKFQPICLLTSCLLTTCFLTSCLFTNMPFNSPPIKSIFLITGNNVQAPNGFGKVTLPFLDPNEASQKHNLPPVFIAPVGYKVPPGYKGHPLPYDPTIGLDKLDREKVNLIHSTSKPSSNTPSPNEVLEAEHTSNPFVRYTKKPPINEPEQEVKPVIGESYESFDRKRVFMLKVAHVKSRKG